MRPDFITPEHTPDPRRTGAVRRLFKNNHAAYPSSTNVNGAVLATGDYPAHNGVISNQEFRAEIDPLKQFDTADFAALDAVDARISKKFIAVPTVAETVQKAGYRTAIAGSKPVVQLTDRTRKRENQISEEISRGLPRQGAAG